VSVLLDENGVESFGIKNKVHVCFMPFSRRAPHETKPSKALTKPVVVGVIISSKTKFLLKSQVKGQSQAGQAPQLSCFLCQMLSLWQSLRQMLSPTRNKKNTSLPSFDP
jgi:hypothetical protein